MRLSLPPCCRLLALSLLCFAGVARAQTAPPPASAAPAPAAKSAATSAATDVILRLDGREVPGRVLLITPTELRYLPAPAAGAPAAAAAADTLRLPVAEVFLVRYANGTREVLTRPAVAAEAGAAAVDNSLAPLEGLSGAQRQLRGRGDATRYYGGNGAFWGSLGGALYGGPVLGVVTPAVLGGTSVKPQNLRAPQPQLLRDADYARGYQQQADRTKRRRAWTGYGVGTAAYVVLAVAFLSNLYP